VIAHINTRGLFSLNPLNIGRCSTIRAHSRMVSGAVVKSHALVLEHTLVLNGEVIEDYSVCQGWPCRSVTSTHEYNLSRQNKVNRSSLSRREIDADVELGPVHSRQPSFRQSTSLNRQLYETTNPLEAMAAAPVSRLSP
jgi:hypothetical protein